MNKQYFEFQGILIDKISFAEAVERIITLAQTRGAHYVVTPNVDHIMRLKREARFREVYRAAALTVADGMPIIWASHFLKNPLPQRVTGADLLPALCEAAAQKNLRIYLLGAPEGVGLRAAQHLQEKYKGLQVAGVYSPPFGFEKNPAECEKIVKQINAVNPDIVFVGLGAPKQEYWIADNRAHLQVGVLLGIGAAIAFAAGTERRAPRWMQKTGLEWLNRWWVDPKRMTMRYLKNFMFFGLVLQAWWQQSKV